MEVEWRAFGETFVTLLVIMDPVGNATVFVALTRDRSPRDARTAALGAVAAAAGLVIGFALFGQLILDYLHVSIESLSIAGGLLLGLVALQMLSEEGLPAPPPGSTLLVPLATPLLAGPGAIATVMVLANRHDSASGRLAVFAGIAAVLACLGVALLLADVLGHLVRPSVVHFLTRVLGLLLSAIAVQLVVDAVRSLISAGV